MHDDGFYGSGGGNGAGSATPNGAGFVGTGVGGTGGGGGVGSIWDKLTVLERNQDKILSRIDQLENVRDAKSEPENPPIGHSLSKEQIADKLLFNKQRDIEDLKTKIADKHKLLLKMMDERDRYKNQMNAKQKVLEDVIDQRDRFSKENYKLRIELEDVKKSNEYLRGTLKNYEDRVAELDQENNDVKGFSQNIRDTNVELVKQIELLEGMISNQKIMIVDYKNLIKQWEPMKGENANLKYTVEQQAQTIAMLREDLQKTTDLIAQYDSREQQANDLNSQADFFLKTMKDKEDLEKSTAFWMQLCHKLQGENGDLKWLFENPEMVEKQTARKCLGIVTKIKNEPLTTVSTHREWMVAICEDIELEIKKEFELK